ncbi:MAG: minor capsid protein [Actinomycetota bacterium]|nr:minor capsid protein [Actinomycetota bacterium]
MGVTVNFLTGMGQYLEAQNVADFTSPWGVNDTAVTIDALPASPDKAVAMTVYPVSFDAGTDAVMGLQFRVRGSPGNRVAAKDILDRLLDVLDQLQHTTIGGIPIVRMWHQSGAYLGTDTNNRPEHTANFYIQHTRTGTHRND